MSVRITVLALLSSIALTAVLSSQGLGGAGWAPRIERIPSPAPEGSAQPQLSTSDRGVMLSWVDKDGERATLKYSERTASGWTSPRAAAAGTGWFVNWADVPSVIRLADGTIVGHWLQKSGADTYAYDVRLSHSKDDGKTWSPSFTPHTDGTKTEHGFASLFQMPGAGLGLVWLDGRSMKPDASHGAPAAGYAGSMSVRFAAYGRDWKPRLEGPVALRVCECCPTSVAVTSDGPIAAFRNRTEEEVRDIYVARFESGKWSQPKAVHEDGWKINACPVNGPMLSAQGRDVAIAWFTAQGDKGQAFMAFSKDAGRTFGTPIRLDDSTALGRVDVQLMPDAAAVASWIELTTQGAQFRIRRVETSGAKSAPVTVSGIGGSRASGYPRIARQGDELVFAWIESSAGRSQVQTAVARYGAGTAR